MTIRFPLSIALVVLTGMATIGCRSDESSRSAAVDFPCICGTPEAAMEGCLHPRCAAGETNPDNPDCACGTLSFGKEKE